MPEPTVYPAATVLLLRDTAAGLQVFMVVRHYDIDSFSGALVFPGGKLDPADRDPGLRDCSAGVAHCDAQELAFRVAAVRESFEECGVLLARRRGQSELLQQAELGVLQPYRQALLENRIGMLELCQAENLELALDQLRPFAHWITPRLRPKVFDTHFFLAATPPSQQAIHDGHEALDSMWIGSQEAIQKAEAGSLNVIFPTRMNLQRLNRAASVSEAFAMTAREPIIPVQPEVEIRPDGQIMTIPPHTPYGVRRVFIPKDGRLFKVLE